MQKHTAYKAFTSTSFNQLSNIELCPLIFALATLKQYFRTKTKEYLFTEIFLEAYFTKLAVVFIGKTLQKS